MMRAIWNRQTIAASDETVVVEGNHYFPADSVNMEHLTPSSKTTVCPWKGTASYFHIVVGDAENQDAAWYYPAPKEAAAHIAGHVAFWRGVEIQE